MKRAELTSAMHRKYPREMPRSRVVSEGVRTIWPMATSGMYVPEEVVEFAPAKPAARHCQLNGAEVSFPAPLG